MITLAETQDNVPETSYSVCFRHVFGSYNIRGYVSLRIGNVLFQMLLRVRCAFFCTVSEIILQVSFFKRLKMFC